MKRAVVTSASDFECRTDFEDNMQKAAIWLMMKGTENDMKHKDQFCKRCGEVSCKPAFLFGASIYNRASLRVGGAA